MRLFNISPILFFGLFILNTIGCTSWHTYNTDWNRGKNKKSIGKVLFKPLWIRSTVSNKKNQRGYTGPRHIHSMSPIVTENSVYVGNGIDGISAYNRNNGQLTWKFPIEGGISGNGASVSGRLFVPGGDSKFYSIDLSSGKVIWSHKLSTTSYAAPLVSQGNVYFVSGDNTLYALDALTGNRQWTYHRNQTSSLSVQGGGKPVKQGSTVYVGMNDGYFVAVNSENGKLLWEKPLEVDNQKKNQFTDIDADPVILNNRVYISSYSGALYCLDLQDGNTIWKIKHGGHKTITLSQQDPSTLFYPSSEGKIFGINIDTGKIIWQKDLSEGVPTKLVPYKIKGEEFLLYGETDGDLKFINSKSGKGLGKFTTGRGITASPTVAGSQVFLLSNEGYIYAFDIL